MKLKWPLTGLVFGSALTLHSAWIPVKAWVAHELILDSWHQLVHQKKMIKPWPWADTRAVAKLKISRLNQQRVVLLGADPTSLAFSVGAMQPYHQIRLDSPMVIAGHNDTHFAFLQEVVMDDVISLTDEHGINHLYKVENIAVIDEKIEQLQLASNEHNLVLITCYPFNAASVGGSERYVITAKRLV